MIPVIFALLFLVTTLYAIALDQHARRRRWEPDWTWIEVAIGSSFCLAAATAVTYAALGVAGLAIAAFFWLAFFVGGLPIVAWQMTRMSSRYRAAADEARRLLERDEGYVNATTAVAESCRGEPRPGEGNS